jgi:hypothetical protein
MAARIHPIPTKAFGKRSWIERGCYNARWLKKELLENTPYVPWSREAGVHSWRVTLRAKKSLHVELLLRTLGSMSSSRSHR